MFHTDHERVVGNTIQCKGTVGSAVELYCSFNNSNSSIDLTFEWQKTAGEVLSNHTSARTIKFNSFNLSDAGTYHCRAFSDGREVLCGKIDLTTGS